MNARDEGHETVQLSPADRLMVQQLSLATALGWLGFGIAHYGIGRELVALVHGLAFVPTAAALALARWRGDRLSLAIGLVVGAAVVGLTGIALLTGGPTSPAMVFLGLVPLGAGLLRKATSRLACLMVSLSAMALVGVLAPAIPSSLRLEPGPIEASAAPVGLGVLLFVFGSLWYRRERDGLARLDARERIVERSRVELAAARDQALRASKTKSRFVAMTSHELRGPINGILGMSHALRDTRLSPPQRDLVDALATSAESLAKLLQDLLDLAKIEAGHLDIVARPYEPRELVSDVIDQLAHLAGAKGIEIAASTAPDVHPVLMGDAGRLRQVLVNLVGNAIKFTSKGSVTLRARTDHEHMIFDVVDTGDGISAADVERIFAPFEQVSAELVDRRAGTGLGLWISRSITDLMQGRLEVTSVPRRGSTFSVVLPLVRSDEVIEPAWHEDGPPPAVIVMAASPVTTSALCDAAAELGAEAHAVPDLTRALALASARPKVLIVDLDDPAGEAVLRRLEPRPPRVRVVVAASSRNLARAEAIARSIDAGVLLKPPRASRLADALARALGRASYDPTRSIDGTINGTILIVDDDAINRKVAGYAAEQLGLAFEEAADGESALRTIAERRPDVVLLDLHLVGIDGVEIARRIVERWPRHDRPAMLGYTASTNEADRRRCLDAGMQDLLAKPIEPISFAAAIAQALRQRARRSGPAEVVTAVVDERVYAKLRRTVGNAVAAEVLSEFLEGIDARFDEIAAASRARDKARLVFAAHASASVVATFGASALGAALRHLEDSAKDVSWDAIEAQLEAVGTLRAESEAQLRRLLAASPPEPAPQSTSESR